jgi:hypothetical protein
VTQSRVLVADGAAVELVDVELECVALAEAVPHSGRCKIHIGALQGWPVPVAGLEVIEEADLKANTVMTVCR